MGHFRLDLHLELHRGQTRGDREAGGGQDPGGQGPGTQSPGGLRAGLETALRDAVRTGRLSPGTRLPSSRALAADLGLARNTVADAYGQLVAEGWLAAERGSGTRVAERVAADPGLDAARPPGPAPAAAVHLRAGVPDLSAFPRSAWLAAARRALAAAPSEALGYGRPAGPAPSCAGALAGYLARARGVADPRTGSWSAPASPRASRCWARCCGPAVPARWRWRRTAIRRHRPRRRRPGCG